MCPIISIIIPNYNKQSYIEETLSSVLNQSFLNWEAIIVDDDSADASQEVIKRISETDNRIRFIQRDREPKGGSVCRNIGIEKAKGEYLMFFDSDDLMSCDCLLQRVDYMQKYSELDFAVFPVGTFYKSIGDSRNVWQAKQGNHLPAFLRHNLPWNIMSPIWKTSFVIDSLKGFDEAFPRLQDVEFHTRALLVPNIKYSVIEDVMPMCFYRIDIERTNQSQVIRLKTMLSGIDLYIKKFEKLIPDKKLKKNLRGTLFAFQTQTNYYKAISRITEEDYLLITNLLHDEIMKISDLFPSNRKRFLSVYNFLYQKGFWHIKGFNFVTKYLFINL
jgi:glycosyltransferase involved in cell wall biosynthesis